MSDISLIISLLLIFQLKHFLADYPLQTKWMLGKFKNGTGWILPLTAHCLVHSLFTLFIVIHLNPSFWYLFIFDFVIHFIMDRVKAWDKLLGRFKPEQPFFWWSLGFDQMIHHITHYVIIWVLVS